jgi:hypothetical protein
MYHFTYLAVLKDLTLACHISSTSCQILSKLPAINQEARSLFENVITIPLSSLIVAFLQ